ncbi:helix-turn-helix domain-containing protein [Actinoplanes sp. NPDC089786]|uniref:helix-turn-helix domain-containing protein n=1 Tax=Actinoplanes sp. NPDC089786 TaxID=3155185 RepID=UPI00343EE214
MTDLLPATKPALRTYPALTDAERARLTPGVVEAYARGDHLTTIAAATGCNKHAVRRLLIEAGVTLRTRGGGGPRPGIADASTAGWAAAYGRGDSLEAIAAASGRGTLAVRRYLVREGVNLRKPGPQSAIADPSRASWAAAYARGDSLTTIANATGRSIGTIHRHLLRAGVTLRDPSPHYGISETERQRRENVVVAAYARGDTIRAIAATTGYSYGCIHKVLTDAGVERRPRGGGQPPSAPVQRPQSPTRRGR